MIAGVSGSVCLLALENQEIGESPTVIELWIWDLGGLRVIRGKSLIVADLPRGAELL